MDDRELDDDPYERYTERRRLMESVLGEYGWDSLRAWRNDHGAFDCDVDPRAFYVAAEQLKADLEAGRCFADTDADIIALTKALRSPWWRFVDPRLSRARTSPTSRSVVVLWECGYHMIALKDKGDGTWLDRSGTQDVVDLLDQMEHEAALEAEMYEPELVDTEKLSELLDPEDHDRRRLVPEESFAQLEDPDS